MFNGKSSEEFSTLVLLKQASSCKPSPNFKMEVAEKYDLIHIVWRPLSKTVFGLHGRLSYQSKYNCLTIMCGLCIHSSTPKPQPCSFSWNTSAHKQKAPLLLPWNKQEGPLELWSYSFSPAPNFFRLFTKNWVIATSCSASCLSTRKALLWHEVLWAANYI